MKRLLFILFLLLPLIIVAQAPIWRNSFTTNQAPPVIGTNVGISNTASSFMWKFYGGSDPNRVAVLSDIVGGTATNAIGNLNGYGTNTTFFGPLIWGSTNVMDEIETMIKRSNGFGTNLTLFGLRFSMSTTGLVYTNFAATYPRVGISTNFPQSILHINTEYPSMCSLLVASNNWQGVNPSLIITNGFVGIGQHRPISELELKGNEVVSGWIRVTNGLRVAGGMAVIQDFTNSGTAYLTNTPTSGNNQTALAINTNAVSGVAVVQIAAGTNGSTGRSPTNQWVILYTNAIYGKGFAVETNGNVTASAFNGSSSPGGGAFIADLDGNGTNTTLYGVGSSNIAYWTDKEWTLTNTGYGTRMRWQAPLGTLKTDGGLGVGGGATIGDGVLVTNNVVVFGAVYAQGFTNTSAAAIFSDVTPSKIAVFGPDRDLTNSTIDAADLSKIGTTNFPMIRVTNVADVGLGILLRTNILPTPSEVGNSRGMSLAVSNIAEGKLAELWFMYSTNGTALHVPMRQNFGSTRFDKLAILSGGTDASNTFNFWQLDTTNRFFFRNLQSGGLYIRPQVATNDGAGGYGGLMDIALRTDVTNYPVINGPTFVGGATNAGILVVSNSGGTFAVVVTNSSTAKGTYIGTNGNISTSGNISTAAGTVSGDGITGGYVISSAYVRAPINNFFQFGGGTGPGIAAGSQTNSIRLLDSFASGNQTSASVSNGASLLLPPSWSLPNVGAGNLTSSVFGAVWAIGNTNGTLTFQTSTNGTNILTPLSIQASNGTINVIGPVLSTSSSSNSPVNNELVQAQWVRSLLSGSGVLYYGTTNITTATNIGGFPSFVYAYSTEIPYPGSRTYAGVTNSQYIGAIVTTNTFQAIQGPVVVNAYMGFNTGGGRSVTVHPEIYFSYDRTNWFGDYECANQALSGGSNLYQFVISFPSYTSTSSAGFYVERRFKIGTQNANPDVTFYLGTNTPSSISFAGPSSVSGNAYLGGNNTWTGSNIFTLPILGDGSLLTNVPFVISSNGVNFINATNLNFYGFDHITNTSGRIDVGANASAFGVTGTLTASNIVSTNFTVDALISTTLELSNAMRVPFGGTGTNTNVIGSFFVGNGTNAVKFLDTNTYANWITSNALWILRTTNDLAGAQSNIVVNMDVPSLEVTVTNNITLTNFTGLVDGTSKSKVIFLKVTVGGPWSVAYPAWGTNYGLVWRTNKAPQLNALYTSLTNTDDNTYVLSLTSRGTNVYPSMTEWK